MTFRVCALSFYEALCFGFGVSGASGCLFRVSLRFRACGFECCRVCRASLRRRVSGLRFLVGQGLSGRGVCKGHKGFGSEKL